MICYPRTLVFIINLSYRPTCLHLMTSSNGVHKSTKGRTKITTIAGGCVHCVIIFKTATVQIATLYCTDNEQYCWNQKLRFQRVGPALQLWRLTFTIYINSRKIWATVDNLMILGGKLARWQMILIQLKRRLSIKPNRK